MFCVKCGNQVSDNAGFCNRCGAPLDDGRPSASSAPVAPVADSGFATTRAIAANRGKGRVTIAVAAIAAVLVVVGVGFGIWAAFFSPYDINEDRFPDPMVRSAILAQLDPDGDGKVSREEAASLESLSVEGAVNVSGLGLFPNLRSLELSGGILRSVDVSDCSSLETLEAVGCEALSELLLGEKPALRTLEVAGAQLGSLDLSGASVLETLDVEGSPLAELLLSDCQNLASLNARDTGIASLDLGSCPALANLLIADSVQLDNLDATPLHEHWVISAFSQKVPSLNNVDGYEVRAEGEFDELGRLTALNTYQYDQEERFEYTYDEMGRCIAMDDEGTSGSPAVHWDMSYTEGGQLSRAVSDRGDKWEVSYDSSGRPAECIVAVGQGGASKIIFSYDEEGRLASWRHVYEGNSESAWTIGYDDAGLVRSVDNNAADEFSRESYATEYDADKRPTLISFDWGHFGSSVEQRSYNVAGQLDNVVKEVRATSGVMSQGNPSVSSTSFEYDAVGRLVKWKPTYQVGSDAGDSAQSELALSYRRFLTTEEQLAAASFVDTDSILWPSLDPYFWNPLYDFDYSGAAFQIASGNTPSIFAGTSQIPVSENPSDGENGEGASDDSSPGSSDEDRGSGGAPVGFHGITQARASSEFPVDAANDSGYEATNVLDGDTTHAWVEGASGTGAGEWIALRGDDVQSFSGFTIWCGYQKSEDIYGKNARPARIGVYVDDQAVGSFDLNDAGLASQRVDFGGSYVGQELKIVIEEVYPGSRDEDCAISEIEVF